MKSIISIIVLMLIKLNIEQAMSQSSLLKMGDLNLNSNPDQIARRIRQPIIIAREEIKKILRPIIPSLDGTIIDFDGTLTNGLGGSICMDAISLINELASHMNFYVVTDASLPRLKKQLLPYMRGHFYQWDKFHIYPWGGGAGYGFTETGEIKESTPYYYEPLSEEIQEKIYQAINDFVQQFGETEKAGVYNKDDFRITLFLSQNPERTIQIYEIYMDFFRRNENLTEYIEKAKLYITRSRKRGAIHFNSRTKYHARQDIFSRFKPKFVIVVGDGINDWVMRGPHTILFNVGLHDEIPDDVHTLRLKGPEGLLMILNTIKELLEETPLPEN